MKFLVKNLFSKYDQIRSFLRIWSHLLNKFLMGNFTFCAMLEVLPLSIQSHVSYTINIKSLIVSVAKYDLCSRLTLVVIYFTQTHQNKLATNEPIVICHIKQLIGNSFHLWVSPHAPDKR